MNIDGLSLLKRILIRRRKWICSGVPQRSFLLEFIVEGSWKNDVSGRVICLGIYNWGTKVVPLVLADVCCS